MSEHTTQAEVSGSLIDLAIGHPSPRLLPLELLRRAAAQSLGQGDPSILQYGYEQGDSRFREALSRFLAESCDVEVEAREVFVSGGVSQALDLICTVFTRPGDLVLVEEPSYFLALRIFADHGLRVESVPTDSQGLATDVLERRLAELHPVLLYTVPTHQNPTGVTVPEQRREALVRLSRKHGLLLIADEVYHLLSYGQAAPRTFAAHVHRGKILSLGSFSKILAPGLRLGWIVGQPRLLQPLASCGFLDSGGGLAPFTSALVRSALEHGELDGHLQLLRRTYGERASAMTRSLQRYLGDRVRFTPPGGGFFHWIDFGSGSDSEKLLSAAWKRGVTFVPGGRFSSCGEQRARARLSFSYYDPPEIDTGIARLAAALAD
jgi:2-aminoadipate transaminase